MSDGPNPFIHPATWAQLRENYLLDLLGNLDNHPDPDKVALAIIEHPQVQEEFYKLIQAILISEDSVYTPVWDHPLGQEISQLYVSLCEEEAKNKYPE